MWSGFFEDRDLKMKLCSLLLCCVATVQNVRADDETKIKFPDATTENPAESTSKPIETTPSQNETTLTQDFSAVQFSADLYEAVKENQPQNFILSPLSVRNALATLSLGAMNETAEEIRRSLKFPEEVSQLINEQAQLISSLKGISSQDSKEKFVSADKIYANSGLSIKTEYKNAVTGLGGEIETVDFGNSEEAAGNINKWVRNKTEGKIEKLVEASDLSSQTSLLVLNTIYFKGSWRHQFDNSSTRKESFFLNGSCSVTVDMMFQESEFHLADLEDAKAQVILLPYEGERLSMMIFLPKEESSLDFLENWLKNQSTFDIQKEHFDGKKPAAVLVHLPKFKIRSSLDLNEPLKNLGLGKMFHQSAANFSGIFDGSGNFFVSKVSQETFIEVNEEGTEAAAVTGLNIAATSFSSPPHFKANRPFLFQIVDSKTKTLLFSGRVKNPLDSVDSSLVDCKSVETTTAAAAALDTDSDLDLDLERPRANGNSPDNEENPTAESNPTPKREKNMEKVMMEFMEDMKRTMKKLESKIDHLVDQVQQILPEKTRTTTTTAAPFQPVGII